MESEAYRHKNDANSYSYGGEDDTRKQRNRKMEVRAEKKQGVTTEKPPGHVTKYGVVACDGNGTVIATFTPELEPGHRVQVLKKFAVELPKKHSRGGQSALRFAHLRLEKRANYARKVCQALHDTFLTSPEARKEGGDPRRNRNECRRRE